METKRTRKCLVVCVPWCGGEAGGNTWGYKKEAGKSQAFPLRLCFFWVQSHLQIKRLIIEQWRHSTSWVLHLIKHERRKKKVEVKKNVFDACSSIFFEEMHLLFFQQCHLQSPRICCLPRLSSILLRISYHMEMLSSTRKASHGWHQEYFRTCFLTRWMESICPVIPHGPRKIIYLL